MVLTFFNACQKDELEVDPAGETVLQEKPDIYLEENYLVFKNFETVENTLNELNNQSFEAKQQWETQLGFKSAMTYRSELSNKLEAMDDLPTAEKFISELASKGYFSMQDSCLSYPFYNVSWNGVLNPNGLVKIGDVLYCFQEDKQIIILDGSKSTLTRYLSSDKIDDGVVKVISSIKTRSVGTQGYGELGQVVGYKDLNYYHRLIVTLYYEAITIKDPEIPENYIQTGVKLYLSYHSYRKKLWYWLDYNTLFYYKNAIWSIGGNYDHNFARRFPTSTRNNTPVEWTQLNTSKAPSYEYVIYTYNFGTGNWYSPVTDRYPGPVIDAFQIEVDNNKIDPMTFDIYDLKYLE